MSFTIKFKTDNAAFEDFGVQEIHRILNKIEAHLNQGMTVGIIFDLNGNRIGEWKWKK